MKMNEPLPGATATSLRALEDRAAFLARHIGTTDDDQAAMLAVLGYANRGELIDAIVPPAIRERAPVKLAAPVPEAEALARLHAIAAQNKVLKSFIGQGYYGTHTPGVILRNILENPAWYTAYTPYQPEISQGRLEALVNFQTMVCDLTGMAIANASMLDEATAAAEAMALAFASGKVAASASSSRMTCSRRRWTWCARAPVRSASTWSSGPLLTPPRVAPSPSCCNTLAPRRSTRRPRAGRCGARAWRIGDRRRGHPRADVARSSGRMGADVVVGSTQRFGVPIGYGGPHAGFFAT